MPDCCSKKTSKNNQQCCPGCGAECKSVAMKTLYHQVKYPINQNLKNAEYFFCSSKFCIVGYFSSDNELPKQQLRAYQNIQQGWLCYCFDISEADYSAAINGKRSEAIKQFVIEKTKLRLCACDTRNPAGHCCLVDFKTFENNNLIIDRLAWLFVVYQ